jgi:glutathione S-transferase
LDTRFPETTNMYKLVIANKNYSSWSLRAWLFLRESNIPFEEIRIPLFTGNWAADVAGFSPAGRVPILIDGDIRVWDSMAIFEYLRHKHAATVDWPESPAERAHALSVSAEMHSGFLALREELPQNIRARNKLSLSTLSQSCRKQIARIDSIWSDCREKYGHQGDWLFGTFSISDIVFAPVALRFCTYSIPLSNRAGEYVDAVQNLDSVRDWTKASIEEQESLSFIDNLVPATSSPLTPG